MFDHIWDVEFRDVCLDVAGNEATVIRRSCSRCHAEEERCWYRLKADGTDGEQFYPPRAELEVELSRDGPYNPPYCRHGVNRFWCHFCRVDDIGGGVP
jgi:hypothetical protein